MLQDLPEVVLSLICEHLSYEDVAVLRCTCKDLKAFVDGKKFTKLNLFVRKHLYHHRLFYTGDPVGYPHSLHPNDLTILDSPRFRQRFANVRRMAICSKSSAIRDSSVYGAANEIDLNRLNHFRVLKKLDIDQKHNRIKGKLDLKELEVAAFRVDDRYFELKSSFELNCPRLKALMIRHCRPVLTSETDQLDYLHFDDYDDCFERTKTGKSQTNYLKSISPNLQRLSTICLRTVESSLQLLSDLKMDVLLLPSLSRFQLELLFNCPCLERVDELANSLEDLWRDPRTKSVQFTFSGRTIGSSDGLRQVRRAIRANDIAGSVPDSLGCVWFLSNSKISRINQNPELDFFLSAIYRLRLSEKTELNEELIKKLKSVEYLEFCGEYRPSESTFELFARTCKSLRWWTLYGQKVTKRLLKMLCDHLLNLEFIEIKECKFESLKPLAKFRNLEHIELDFHPPVGQLTYIYENSRTLGRTTIDGKKRIELLRTTTEPRLYRIEANWNRQLEFHTLQAMIDHYWQL